MYTRIYRKAWQALTDETKMLLTIMPMSGGRGMDPERLSRHSGLAEDQLWPALEELVRSS